MSLKTVGIIVAVVGLLVGLAFVLADVIGIGQDIIGIRVIGQEVPIAVLVAEIAHVITVDVRTLGVGGALFIDRDREKEDLLLGLVIGEVLDDPAHKGRFQIFCKDLT